MLFFGTFWPLKSCKTPFCSVHDSLGVDSLKWKLSENDRSQTPEIFRTFVQDILQQGFSFLKTLYFNVSASFYGHLILTSPFRRFLLVDRHFWYCFCLCVSQCVYTALFSSPEPKAHGELL